MKKKFMRMISMLMVLVMTLGVCVTGYADDAFTITVENSIGDKTYSAYKIFDASYDSNSDAVSYTINSESAWYSAVSEATDIFTLTETSVSGVFQVTVNNGASGEAVLEVLKNAFDEDTMTPAATGTGNGGAIELDVHESGYYFVTTTSGSVVSIDTAAPKASIVDKNQKPGEGGSDPKDPDWNGGFTKDADTESVSVGDKISYTIKSYVPTYDGESVITSYTITDTMGSGLTYDNNAVVTLIGTGLTDYEDITNFCTISLDNHILTITWDPAVIGAASGYTYPADAVITIKYTATVNEAADETDLTNNVAMEWTKNDGTTGDTDDNPEVTIYTYGFDLTKTDGTDKLDGAEFTLQKAGSSDPITFLYDENSNTYEEWDGIADGTTTATISVTGGEVNIWGLAAGTYILTETKAPDGYNLLTAPMTIEISGTDGGWTVTYEDSTSSGVFGDAVDGHGVASMAAITVVNNAGSSLPSTGGIGTTIFYVVGTILVLSAAALVVTKMRLGKAE